MGFDPVFPDREVAIRLPGGVITQEYKDQKMMAIGIFF
jgi:hypothetical protein